MRRRTRSQQCSSKDWVSVARLRRGFTLVEVLVVLGVIGVLMSLVLPALSSFKNETRSTHCLSNLRQLFTALETARQTRKDLLPYAAPLPVGPGQTAVVVALPEKLKAILPPNADVWMCPADESQDSADLGTSYIYVPGAFMLLEPMLLPEPPAMPLSEAANAARVERVVTERFTRGYLHHVPVLADSDDYHINGNRNPRNAVFIDGNARVVKPDDGKIEEGPAAP
jgi:prepilin-type N-terminal cleavage/methylation domain-containing protein